MEHDVSFEASVEGETWCEEIFEISFEGRIGRAVSFRSKFSRGSKWGVN